MSEPADTVTVEVACGTPERQRVERLSLPVGCTAREAVRASTLSVEFPELALAQLPLAIFGVRVPDDQVLRDGERVELLRPLERDPRDARRELAAKGLTIATREPGDGS